MFEAKSKQIKVHRVASLKSNVLGIFFFFCTLCSMCALHLIWFRVYTGLGCQWIRLVWLWRIACIFVVFVIHSFTSNRVLRPPSHHISFSSPANNSSRQQNLVATVNNISRGFYSIFYAISRNFCVAQKIQSEKNAI